MNDMFIDKYILIDTCSLMHSHIKDIINDEFIRNINNGTSKLIITDKVVNELKRLILDKDEKRKNKAKIAIEIIDKLVSLKNFKYLGSEDDSFTDHNFIDIYLKYGDKISMLLITQDVELAKALDNIRNQRIFNLNKIKLFKINFYKKNLTEWNIKN